MDFINKNLEKQDISFDDLIDCFERIKTNGDIAVIKFDGERNSHGYTVFVSFPNSKKEMIRADEGDLKKALIKVLSKYIEE